MLFFRIDIDFIILLFYTIFSKRNKDSFNIERGNLTWQEMMEMLQEIEN